jgi:hypothetical protein
MLRKINEGILHPYSFIAIALGFIVENYLKRFIANRIKK